MIRLRWRILAVAVLLGALLSAALVLAGSAAAHAMLVNSDPQDGSRLKSVPRSVSITFDEQVGLGTLGYLHVTDQTGKRIDSGRAYHPNGNATKIADNLQPGLPDGTYTESYRVISADSHPVGGVVRFVVGNGVLSAASVAKSATDRGVGVTLDAVRWVSFAGFALLGGAWLLLTIWPQGRDDRRARSIVWAGWVAAAIGALGELLLQGPYDAGSGLTSTFDRSLVDATLRTDYGQFRCARLLVLGAIAVLLGGTLQGVERRRIRFEDAYWPLMIGLAFTFSAVGHAETTYPNWLSLTSDVIHLAAMAAWVGGLVVLVGALLPRREPDELHAVLPVFSRVAFAAIVAIAVTGTYAAWRGVGTLGALLSTNYGLLVSTKVVLFIGLMSLGNLSRRAVQHRFARMPIAYAMSEAALKEAPAEGSDDDIAVERLRRSVLVEVALAVLVLAATAVLVAQPRGKEAVATRERQPVSVTSALGGGRTVTVTIDPGRHGVVTAAVALSPGAQPKHVTATATLPAKQLGPIPLQLATNGKDLYAASGVDLPVSGNWVVTLVVTFSDFNAISTDATVHLY